MRVKIIDINKTYENKYVFSLCEDYINFCHIKIYKFDRNIKKIVIYLTNSYKLTRWSIAIKVNNKNILR